MKQIPYGFHSVNFDDLKNILKVNKSDTYTNGKYLNEFEVKTKKFLNSKYSVAVNSGTSAIHLAFKAINLKEGDNIILPAINFIAAFSMAQLCKANIYLADIDYRTGQMSPQNIIDCIKKNKIRKVKAFVSMYLGGSPEYIKDFYTLKKKLNCFYIEDACHAFGASYIIDNKMFKVGSCNHSDICTFSFHPVKTITTGEGGLVTTNNFNFFKKIKEQRSHGIIRDNNKPWKYKIKETSLNYRISEINCLLGLSQIKKTKKFLSKRHMLAKTYNKNLVAKSNILNVMDITKPNLSAWHLYIILIDFEKLKISKEKFINLLLKKKIVLQQHYIPTYRVLGMKVKKQENYPNSEKYFKTALSLPLFSDLSISKLKYVIKTIIKTLNYAVIKKRKK